MVLHKLNSQRTDYPRKSNTSKTTHLSKLCTQQNYDILTAIFFFWSHNNVSSIIIIRVREYND